MTRKFSAFGTLTGAAVDGAADYVPIVDASVADASKNKKITVDELAIAVTADTLQLSGGEMTGALTLADDPSDAMEAATKQYVDGLALNLGKRQTVRVTTTANITISTALNSGDTLDGVTLATNDLVLVKNQSTPAQNGVYVVEVVPTRSTEFDTYDEHPGSLVAVQEGTAGADTIWLCTSNAGGTLNTTPIVFSQSSTAGGGGYSAGTGLDLTGKTFSIGDAELLAIAGLTSAADKGIQFTGSGTAATYDLTAAGKALLDDADATAQRATLGLVIGTNVQAYDGDLAALAGLTSAADKGIQFTGSGAAATYDLTAAGKALLDDADAAAQRVTLGLSSGGVLVAIDGGGSAITTGLKGYLGPMPFGGTITEATMIVDQTGSIVIEIWKCTYSDFDAGSTHPVSGDKITASAPPTISTGTKSQDSTLTGWTTAFSAGDIFAFNVNSVTDAERVTLTLNFTK